MAIKSDIMAAALRKSSTPLAHSNSGNGNLRPETLGVTRREGSPERANPTAETGSPRTGYGNVALFPTRGNHVDLRGLGGRRTSRQGGSISLSYAGRTPP